MNKKSAKIGFISLGCPKATVDSENILTQLRAEGYELVSDYDSADLVVVNTCGFIDDAIAESLDTIGEALHENGKVIVTGCLGAKGDIVRQTHPNVLAVTGPHAQHEVMQHVHQHLPKPHDPFVDLVPPQGIRLTPKHFAYLKISEGCNHRCRFCIIPSLRGDLVSRPIADVMREAENLVQSGVKELLVISQDTSAYGIDLKYRPDFWHGQPLNTRMFDLAQALSQFGVWVRLHYVYPYPHVDNVIPLMAENKILPYLDIPFQHASHEVLKAMKRPANSENVLNRLQQWRQICPDIAIRSTFIVGFPGETEQHFNELLDFLREARLDRVGCFMYSEVEGAEANKLSHHVDEETKLDRFERFMQTQAEISADKLKDKVGKSMTVLVDDIEDNGTILARSYADAPEIDGMVIVESDRSEMIGAGDLIQVKIINSDEHDLYAEHIANT